MNKYYRHVVRQKTPDFMNLVLPVLEKNGHNRQKMINLFNNGQVRMRWGRDWNEFTVHTANPLGEPTWKIDELILSMWKGITVPNRLVMTCFIDKQGSSPVSSIAITDLHTLADGLKNHGISPNDKNRHNGQTFIALPFGHPVLSKKVWGIGIRRADDA